MEFEGRGSYRNYSVIGPNARFPIQQGSELPLKLIVRKLPFKPSIHVCVARARRAGVHCGDWVDSAASLLERAIPGFEEFEGR